MHLGAGDEELLPVGRQGERFDLPLALGQLPRGWLAGARVEAVEMHPAVPLREKPQVLLIRQPAE